MTGRKLNIVLVAMVIGLGALGFFQWKASKATNPDAVKAAIAEFMKDPANQATFKGVPGEPGKPGTPGAPGVCPDTCQRPAVRGPGPSTGTRHAVKKGKYPVQNGLVTTDPDTGTRLDTRIEAKRGVNVAVDTKVTVVR